MALNLSPKISVLLPVYNGAQYLHRSIDSVLNQTFGDFELIIINDGSSDNSESVVKFFADDRIQYFSQENQGLAATLNRGIRLAKGKYIARQDQDDISFPNRFSEQINFLDSHEETVMVGSSAEIWVDNKKTSRVLEHPCSDAEVRCGLLFRNYFVHSSVFIRRVILQELGGYSTDPQRQPPEDYELWSRVMRKYKVANIKQPLLAYHEVGGSMSRINKNPFLDKLVNLTAENIQWALGTDDGFDKTCYLANLMHRNYNKCKLQSWISTKHIFLDVMLGFSRKSNLDPTSFLNQQQQLLRYLRYCYLDCILGGFLNRHIQNNLRQKLKYYLIKK